MNISILLNKYKNPHWLFKMIEMLMKNPSLSISIIKISQNDTYNNNLKFIIKKYVELDRKLFKTKHSAIKKEEISRSFKDIEFVEADISVIENINSINQIFSETDIIINLLNHKINYNLFSFIKFGVWELFVGENNVVNEYSIGLEEVLKQKSPIPLYLISSFDDEKKKYILYQSSSYCEKRSVHRTVNSILFKISFFVPRVIKQIQDNQYYNINEKKNIDKIKTPVLGNFEFFWLLLLHIVRYIFNKILSFFFKNQWRLVFYNSNDAFAKQLKKYECILPPKDRFFADPFPVYHKSKLYVFFEEKKFVEKNGFISVLTIDNDGSISNSKKILEENFHLSYPFIILFNNDYYMIPETSSNNKISLYKCDKFPYKWSLHKHLMHNVRAVDTTIFYYDNYYWMFTNIAESDGSSTWDELFLFFSKDLFSDDWNAHPMNPIISDVSKARPAGNIFFSKGEIIRPSQNNSISYGGLVEFNKIITLTKTKYQEINIKSSDISFDKSILGTHTINSISGFTVSDTINRIKKR